MLLDWLHGSLHHWAIFCCLVATAGLVGAFIAATVFTSGKGILAFLNAPRSPTVIVVNGGHYQAPQQVKRWSFGRFYGLFAAIFSGGPMLTLLILAIIDLFWASVNLVHEHPAPIIVLLGVAGLAAVFWWLMRRDRRQEVERYAALPVAIAPAVTAQPAMWSMDEAAAEAWDRRV